MTNLQKDLLSDLKKELCSNIAILIKLKPMTTKLSNYIQNHGVEKLSQPVFNELSYYLVSLIDSHSSASFLWPLYDSKMEKLYRDELYNFINTYSNLGLLSPITSAYLVNPSCFKVIKLLYQMSTLAVQRLLLKKISKERQTLYESVTKKYNSNNSEDFVQEIKDETDQITCKFSKYIHKHKVMIQITEIMCNKIVTMDETLSMLNPQNYIDDIIDGFIEKQPLLDETIGMEIQKIKNVSKPSNILDTWLTDVDIQLDDMEIKWHNKMEPFLNLCQTTQQCTQDLIARHVGETDKNMYMIEYNSKTDEICTKDLQSHVNMEQKYVLKNIIKDGRLSFPYLIRGFLVAIGYILKNAEIEDEIHQFNEYLDNGKVDYMVLVNSMRVLIDRVDNDELKLQPPTLGLCEFFKPKQNLSLPPIPDLTDLRSNRNIRNQVLFDSFTPLNTSKHKFNLFRKKYISFIRPQSMLTTPFHQFLREETVKSVVSCRRSSYNRQHISQNFHNISIVPQSNRINETISECGSGFTKQQIKRLLSTIKRSSSTKKFKLDAERGNLNIKKRGLFNESNTFNENNALIRSHSSPNLFGNREKRSLPKLEGKRLSIMQEHLEVSGIVALEKENSYGTPQSLGRSASANATSLPVIVITPEPEKEISNNSRDIENNVYEDIAITEINLIKDEDTKTETPKNSAQLISKTNSLEKIIKRFKRVKANVLSTGNLEERSGCNEEHCKKIFSTIIEEKENLKTVTVDVITANRNLLPDLLSPNFSRLSQESTEYLDQICSNLDEKSRKKPRESLGTALGVDQTFLDQFDLID